MSASVRAIAPKIRAVEVPAELRLIPGWLIWRFEQYPNEPKPRKVPYWTDGTIRHGQQGSPTDCARLTPFAAARDAAARMGFEGVGFAPLAAFGYTFLDFDNCIGPGGEIDPEIERIIARTYAEYSPSGKGIRAALRGNLGNHKSKAAPDRYGFETFSSSGFVTLTGNILPACELIGLENTVAEIDQHVIDLCERRFGGSVQNNVVDPDDFMAGREPRLGLTPERMTELVNSLDPNMGRQDWIRVGMALHHECDGDDTGFEIWDDWSRDGHTYVSTEALRDQWESFERRKGSNRRQVTMASVIKMVKDATRPTEAASREEMLAKAEAIMAELPAKSVGRFGPVPIYDLTQRQPMGWLIKGVLPKAELGILFGASGSGKTFVALDLAFAIARGNAWRTRRTAKARVVIIAAEGGSGLGKRAQAYAQHYGFDLHALDGLHVITAAPNFLDGDDISEVIAEIKNLGDIDLIIIDTLAQVTPGANENTSEDMGRALGNINLLHDATGAMNLVVHHAGKDLSKGSRGWSGLKAAADVQIEVLRHDNGDREIVIEKMKDGEDGLRWGFKLETVLLGLDDDGDDITSCVAVEADTRPPAATDDKKNVKRRGRLETHILEVMTLFPADAVIRAEDLIRKACDTLPAPEAGKRDIRRQSVVRAIQALSKEKDGPLRMENGVVIFYE
jgi:RecA/RadA recombinase